MQDSTVTAERDKRIGELVDRIECFRVESTSDRQAMYRLRYQCYLREGAIVPNDLGVLFDQFDDSSLSLGVRIDGLFVASIRLHVLSDPKDTSPSAMAFPDHLRPMLAGGSTILDCTRFVVDPDASTAFPMLARAVLRIPFMAAEHFQVDKALAAVRSEHIPFYKRFLRYNQLAEPRAYLQLTKPLALLVADFNESKGTVLERHPSLRGRDGECNALFGPAAAGKPSVTFPVVRV